MSYPSWPAQLPRPERDTWRAQPQDARLKRQSDAGPPAWRRRFSSASTTVAMSVLIKRWQRSIFDDFFTLTTKRGSLLFRMPDPTTDGWRLLDGNGVPLLDGSGTPLLMSGTWLCSFGGEPPVETVVGIEFRKSFTVEVMP